MKLVVQERESAALAKFLRGHRSHRVVTSSLSRVEVVRAVMAGGTGAVAQARRVLSRMHQIALDRDLLDSAAELAPDMALPSLDAIHLATAVALGTETKSIVTYDARMARVASALGFHVESPA